MATESNWHEDVPHLEGWVSLREAANILGISRQQVHNRARNGAFQTLRKVSEVGRTMFVLRKAEVEEMAEDE